MITLEVVRGQSRGEVYELDAPAITIGRAPSNQIVLAEAHLSGEHGQIFREEEQYIYRDLRSTHGSRLRRGAEEFRLDATAEAALRDGDQLSLGDPADPVVLVCRLRAEETSAVAEELAKRDLTELPQVAAKVERDPAHFRALYEASKKLARRGLDPQAVYDGIAETVFELVPRVTHVGIDFVNESDGRFTTVYTKARGGPASFRVSRTVVRRVASERAALWMGDKLSPVSESAYGRGVQSILAVPLWDGETIRGVLQADNRESQKMLFESDLDLLLVLAGQAALAVENARLVERLRVAEERARGEARYLKTREEERRFPGIIGESDAMSAVLRQIEKVKDTRATVCIEGETGTGKELIASAIHYQGNRKDKLFVAQNCAAVPENLLESELFGYKRGAFTGADHDKKGLFELADGGTLFLDEIGEMSLGLQAKLLRVLQEGEVRPVGATQSRKVDVRIICATNRSLEKEVERGAFRQDLYYRLRVFPLRLPALRERRDDVPSLARHFLLKYTAEMKKPPSEFIQEALDQMAAYAWPGNIRELENEVQRLVIQVDPGAFITPDMLSPQIRKVEGVLGRIAPKKGTLKDMMEEIERWLLVEALREHGGNKTKTAETLGITREGLHKKLSKYGM